MQEPIPAGWVFHNIGNHVSGKAPLTQDVFGTPVKTGRYRIIDIHPRAGPDPELLPRAGHDLIDVIVGNRSGVAQIMLVYSEVIPIEPVQSRYSTNPHETHTIPENAVNLVVGQPLVNINPVELIGECLSPHYQSMEE